MFLKTMPRKIVTVSTCTQVVSYLVGYYVEEFLYSFILKFEPIVQPGITEYFDASIIIKYDNIILATGF